METVKANESLEDVNRQIEDAVRHMEDLKRKAEELKATERPGVIEEINKQIALYEIKPGELSFRAQAEPQKRLSAMIGRSKSQKKPRKASTAYEDDQGNSWSGKGPQPKWFKEALANGRTKEQLEKK